MDWMRPTTRQQAESNGETDGQSDEAEFWVP
jgi:hypothetical protein